MTHNSPENKCCENCYGRMGTRAGGGTFCMPRECWCHRVSQDKEPSPSQEEWKVEFVARFPKTPPEDFFIFIGDLLSQARASTLKEVGEEIEKLKRLPKLYFEPDYVDDHDECVIHNKAINAALEAVQTALQDKKLP